MLVLAAFPRCGGGGGGGGGRGEGSFLACFKVLPVVGYIAYEVFGSDTVWACVVATLNLRIIMRSGVWAGCRLCFAVFAAGMVSVVVLYCGWGCAVGCGVALGQGVVGRWGLLCNDLVAGMGAECLGWPL